jgi:RNA polymerase sigma-70 factor (ECF subfamily)
VRASDDRVMEDEAAFGADRRQQLLDLYDDALPQVYGYLVRRSSSDAIAEDLTAETFLAALDACARGTVATPTIPWLVTVARNKLVDHWRRSAREQRKLTLIASDPPAEPDTWDTELDEARVRATLATLGPHHQAALTLRYLDRLPVPDVASELGRTVHATEALLMRAKAAFRQAYPGGIDA